VTGELGEFGVRKSTRRLLEAYVQLLTGNVGRARGAVSGTPGK